ncbi:DNA-binding transcriptional regulator, LacI/PurR family [Actinomyces denticolens]|uniref:DNA-binding transcriptional regulator, LacI/PurR family n=1 Tax=Actinomyces denticolens TaxID=52767 RepID=A0ABY1I534_9ACTO|nr:LacI family DNA-binding transcriptional regulator [Actinomyces denticolens]SHI59959.1 DNA-binding transcriptional regulator, LacI/PurR family [Actinomyces denticolens]
MPRVTLRDIAEALGVSTSTVSLALRGSDRISAAVRERVVQEAADQGYRTDLAGALLRTSKPRIIGLACDIGQELHVAYSREISAVAQARGWLVMMEDTGGGNGAAALGRIMQLRAQAVIVVDPGSVPTEALRGLDAPVVVIGQATTIPNADLVISNNDSGMAQVADLIAGESHVLCFDGGPGLSSQFRRQSFLTAMSGVTAEVSIIPGGATVDAGWAAMRSVLARGPLTAGAAVCYNDQCALGVMAALTRERLIVPDDIRVVGFDNSRIASSEAFELTSVDRDPRGVAALAVERAILRAEGDDSPAIRAQVDTSLVRRRTA